MLMDYELHVTLNEVIATVCKDFHEQYNCGIDMVVMQDDKYRNTEYETITYGLGISSGMKSTSYYFNAINDENNEIAQKYYGEPVSYYEHCGEQCMEYRIEVQPMARVITVFEVGFANKYEPVYHKIQEVKLGKSKFASKVLTLDT